jgi:hypothetical protein
MMVTENAGERVAELKEFIYDTGAELQRVSRQMIDEDTIAQVLRARDGDSSEADAHERTRDRLAAARSDLIADLKDAHRDLAAFGTEA